MEEIKPEMMFGECAGKIWRCLNDSGEMSVYEIMKNTGLKRDEVLGGLGWLGRENKIIIIKEKKGLKYSLKV